MASRKPAQARLSGAKPKPKPPAETPTASHEITKLITAIGDWRGDVLRRMRVLIRQADPAIVEEVKWKKPSNPGGVSVWSHDGIVCTGQPLKTAARITFMKGAKLEDPAGLFNAALAGNSMRAIDIREGDEIDEAAFKELVQAAVAWNQSGA